MNPVITSAPRSVIFAHKPGAAPSHSSDAEVPLMLSVQARPDISGIRTAELFSQEHTVIPAVVLVEGVLWPANAPAPELALAEEFGRFPDGWNGRPVTYDHPKLNGVPVSANLPGVLDDTAIGQLFNTRLEDRKLKTEIWINNARVEAHGGEIKETVERLMAGDEVVEVSTGLFTMQEITEGIYEGEQFQSIWRNIVPDHLAILPQGIVGACSVEDGCGAPRTNQMKPVMRAASMRMAGTTNDKAVPSCGGECKCGGVCMANQQDGEREGIFKKISRFAGGLLNFRDAQKLSDADQRTAISAAMSKVFGRDEFFYILAVFMDGESNGRVVYERGFDGQLYSRSFSVDNGNVSLGDNEEQVRPVTEFVPVEVTANAGAGGGDGVTGTTDEGTESIEQEMEMKREEFIRGLIANESTRFEEEDREFLEGLSDEQLEKLAPVEKAASTETPETEEAVEEPTAELPVAASARTPEDFLKEAPAEIREVLAEGLRMQRSRKDELVKGLLTNKRNRFSKEQLRAKSLEELENLAELASDVSFQGAGVSLTANADGEDDSDDNFAPPPPLVFPRKEASGDAA